MNKKTDKRTITDICIRIFSRNDNKPLYVKDIYSAMRQRQWRTTGKTPTQTIAGKLLSDLRFTKVGRNVFKLDDSFFRARVANGYLYT
jgi:hypothetical protein